MILAASYHFPPLIFRCNHVFGQFSRPSIILRRSAPCPLESPPFHNHIFNFIIHESVKNVQKKLSFPQKILAGLNGNDADQPKDALNITVKYQPAPYRSLSRFSVTGAAFPKLYPEKSYGELPLPAILHNFLDLGQFWSGDTPFGGRSITTYSPPFPQSPSDPAPRPLRRHPAPQSR